MQIEKYISKEYIDRGLKLIEIGINEIAFNKSDALKVLEELEKNSIAVLGGDVYYIKNNVITLTYDNWFINRNDEEWLLYVEKSIKKARSYIRIYDYMNSNVYFTLVIAAH